MANQSHQDKESTGKESQINVRAIHVKDLNEGSYFGEVALVTKLKRTTNVTATDFCTLSTMHRDVFKQAEEEYPTIYLNFRNKVRLYDDHDFNFRRKMIRNIPYLNKISPNIIEDILYLLKPRRYEAGTTIVKRGDKED